MKTDLYLAGVFSLDSVNMADFFLLWILQTWIDSFEIWYAWIYKYLVGHNKEWK
jgi:hypothetical protein